MNEEKNKKNIYIAGVVLAVILAGILVATLSGKISQNEKSEDVVVKSVEEIEKVNSEEDVKVEQMVKEEQNIQISDEDMSAGAEASQDVEPKADPMVDTNKEEVSEKKAGSFVKWEDVDISQVDGKIVLDFSATWCPSCIALKKDIEKNLDAIPADTTIVLVDYDTQTDLKKKYGVTGQHTFVQVKNNGEEVKTWRGGTTLKDVLSNIE